ncbi:hypothetical protein ACLVWU_05460 [Bdellovibrio sp. HCB290]|uniref:hypothetical protein n=1 Tax=Bdellovibrio sp. HCB290 TaxID=3394356 RepID=UPI0039B59FCF
MNLKTHYRRCQHCGNLHNSDNDLLIDCESCGKELVPLYYTQLVKLAQEQLANSSELIKDNAVMKEIVVVGLTADWDLDPDPF